MVKRRNEKIEPMKKAAAVTEEEENEVQHGFTLNKRSSNESYIHHECHNATMTTWRVWINVLLL